MKWTRARWGAVSDGLLAVLLGGAAASAGLTSGEYPHPGPLTAALMGTAGLVLVLRRRRPTTSFLVSMGLMTVTSLLYGSFQAGTSVLIALVSCYSALAHGVGLPLFASVVAVFAVVDGRGPLPQSLAGMGFVACVCGAAGATGFLVRRSRQLSAANVALRELVELESAATTHAAVDDERARVARELHDILSHSLGVVVLQTGAADHAWDRDPAHARAALRAARATAVEAVDQLRALLTVVRDDPGAERAPVRGIEDLGALAARASADGFRVDLNVTGDPRPVQAAVAASVYRVAQEGVANAMKHSGAHGCRIHLDYEPKALVVRVEDDGGGTRTRPGSRVGLVGVRERAALFGGHVEAGPQERGGWRLRVAFPA